MDNLEKFVKEHRSEMDIHYPSERVWKNIDKQVKNRPGRYFFRIAAAATVVLLIGLAALFLKPSVGRSQKNMLPAELQEIEHYYNSLAGNLYLQARPFLTSQPEIEKELINDLGEIDKICSEIKEDLRDNISNREVIEALIRNYNTKVRILEDLLNALNEDEQNEKKPEKNEL